MAEKTGKLKACRDRKFLLPFILLIALLIGFTLAYLIFHRRDRTPELVLYGNVDVRQVDISFRVAGQVEELFFEEGDYVAKGSLMARLDPAPYDSQVLEASSNLEAMRVKLENAEILLERRLELLPIGGVSQEDVDNAQTSRDQLLANLRETESALVINFDNLRYTEAICPNDGIILTRVREVGTVVAPGQPVYTLSLTSPVWVRAYINEPNLGRIHFGMEALVYTDTPKGKIYHGKVGFISPVAEFTPKTVQTTQLRTDLVYRLRIYVDNPDQLLKQGMPVTVKFLN